MIKLDLSDTVDFRAHRSGWGYCMSKLKGFHSKNGIKFNDFIEKDFGWDIKNYYSAGESNYKKYNHDWIGVWHNPPNSPDWFDISNSPQAILKRDIFQKSLKNCKAIVCLSEYLSSWLSERIENPIITVKHPTEIPRLKWDVKNYLKSDRKQIVQIGYWLRKMESIHNLKCSSDYSKVWLPSNKEYAIYLFDIFKKTQTDCKESDYMWSGVDMKRISNEEFDDTLSRCVVFLDQYDSSANNAVVESVARNTPILTNRLPAVEEYLGKDYPLFFDNLDHASVLLSDSQKIYEAHLYLKNMNKRWISGTFFANDLMTKLSEVIQ